MAWEMRGAAGPYYFRSIRVGQRVLRQYCGKGAAARQAAQADEQRRTGKTAELRAILTELRHSRPAQQLTQEQEDQAKLLFEAEMLAAGYRRTNYGRWRRDRAGLARH